MIAPARHLLRARDYMDRHYAEPLDVVDVARRAHASRAHFIREFRDTFGETPHQYLLTRRIERAKHLLSFTSLSITEVSLEVGCQSLGSFSAAFKRIVGMTPRDYRRSVPPMGLPTCAVMAWERPRGRAGFEKKGAGGQG